MNLDEFLLVNAIIIIILCSLALLKLPSSYFQKIEEELGPKKRMFYRAVITFILACAILFVSFEFVPKLHLPGSRPYHSQK